MDDFNPGELRETQEDGGMRASRPTSHTIWQDSYYDRNIQNEPGYVEVWRYLDENLHK